METNIRPDGKLYDKGQALLKAAHEYWEEYLKIGRPGAVVWLKDTSGHFVLFTRGEYLRDIMGVIDNFVDEKPLEFPFEQEEAE